MAFLVQDVNGTTIDANAYIEPAYLTEYANDRDIPLVGKHTTPAPEAELKVAIIKGTQYLDSRYMFVGKRINNPQSTQWPRYNGYDADGYLLSNIPTEVKNATAMLAILSLSQDLMPLPETTNGRDVLEKTEAVGPIKETTKWAAGGHYQMPTYPEIDVYLRTRGLICSGYGSTVRA